jgi:hypothetical protein
MDDDKILRRVRPQAVVTMPLWLKRWLEVQAKEQEKSQSAIVVELLLAYKARLEGETAGVRELSA